MKDAHIQRIIEELKAVGVTRHGLAKSESKELPRILHDDEHIGGVIYGQVSGGSSAMLVATDHRVIYIDRQFLFTTIDELTYDVVSGVKSTSAGLFTVIVLHTRITDYTFRYVNSNCARIFIKYIESKRLERSDSVRADEGDQQKAPRPTFQNITDKRAEAFLKEHDLAVFSTVDRTGNVHGAVVYYLVDQNNLIYIMTKSDTGKGRNVYAHSQVAITVHEAGTLKTLQIQGIAEVETELSVKNDVLTRMSKPRVYKDGVHLPPVTKLQEGSFMLIRITPTLVSYHNYSEK